jgi:hypothetical protein
VDDALSVPITRIHLSALLSHALQLFQITRFNGIQQSNVIIFDLFRSGRAEENLRLGEQRRSLIPPLLQYAPEELLGGDVVI